MPLTDRRMMLLFSFRLRHSVQGESLPLLVYSQDRLIPLTLQLPVRFGTFCFLRDGADTEHNIMNGSSMTTRFIEIDQGFEYFYLDGILEGGAWRDVIQFRRPLKGNGAWVYDFTVRVHRENLHESAGLRFMLPDPAVTRCRYEDRFRRTHHELPEAQRLWTHMVSHFGFITRPAAEIDSL